MRFWNRIGVKVFLAFLLAIIPLIGVIAFLNYHITLDAMLLAFAVQRLWRFSRTSGVLLFFLLALTNWLAVYPMERLKIVNRPWEHDFRMLTSCNFPLKLFVTELFCGYPDVNTAIVDFFSTHTRPGQTVLAEYGDLILQFYVPGLRVIGGLQGPVDPAEKPDWVLRRRVVRVNRDRFLFGGREFTDTLDLARDYERVPYARPDETFGNRTDDPNHHSFIPVEPPQADLEIWRRREAAP